MAQRRAVAYLRTTAVPALPDGFELVATVIEEDVERPRLAQALEMIASREAETLVVSELRDAADSLAQLVRLLDWLGQADASLYALDHRLDSASGAVADATALLRAIERWARDPAPRRRGPGRPGLSAADPALGARIGELRERGLSLQAIADELNRAGVPTPRGGLRWRASSVQSALGYRRPHPPAPGAPPPRPKGPKPGPGGPKHGPGGAKHGPGGAKHGPGGPKHGPGGANPGPGGPKPGGPKRAPRP